MKESPSSGFEPAEPDPFRDEELRAWRGFLRTHRRVTDELDRRLWRTHGLTMLHYGVLITLLTDPGRTMRMTDLAERVLTSPSGMTRAVATLADQGLVERAADPADGRGVVARLTPRGVERLRDAQVTHHACVRELLFGRLAPDDVRRLAEIYEPAPEDLS
jgi:DNA-binding MarR family transcriptional regulator